MPASEVTMSDKTKEKKKFNFKKFLIKTAIVFGILMIILPPILYFGGEFVAHKYAEHWAKKLNKMEDEGRLSRKFGAAWQDIAFQDEMTDHIDELNSGKANDTITLVKDIPLENYPSLSVVERLNEISEYSNSILITDRNGDTIAEIKTDHKRSPYDSLPKTMVEAIVAAEDGSFFTNKYGFEYKSFVRAAVTAGLKTITTFRKHSPKGTSSITQQVAKMFVSKLDDEGRRYVARSVDRKLQEIRLAAALRARYSAEEIMEVYANHCITSSYGLIGVADIAEGLWGKKVTELSDAQSVYIARMVKWGSNYPDKIKRQCHIDMPRIAERLKWSKGKSDSVLAEIDTLGFLKPKKIETKHGHLVDLANLYYQKMLLKNGYSKEELSDFNFIDPDALIRKKGNIEIQLTIDLRVQKFLEHHVNKRGFGGDTTIVTEIRVGSYGEDVTLSKKPIDTLNQMLILTKDSLFTEPDGRTTELKEKDTVLTNIRYRKSKGKGQYRRSVYNYAKLPALVDGQYFTYSIMDSKTGELLAYYSRDKLGSKCVSLLERPVPNGSSTAKPILNAMLFEFKHFKPFDKWNDSIPEYDSVPWQHDFFVQGKKGWAEFKNVARGSKPYRVKNHGSVIEGEHFVFDHLKNSNNILGVESIYRANGNVFNKAGKLNSEFFHHGQFLYNLGLYEDYKKKYAGKEITGVKLYKELARIVGAEVDSFYTMKNSYPISDSLYSIALGTLELTLLEQMHLFNVLYNNTLIEEPKEQLSLFVKKITMNRRAYPLDKIDKKKITYHPFSNLNAFRPTLLGLRKRLTSAYYDKLTPYDIPYTKSDTILDSTGFGDHLMMLAEPLSNFAKSGTSNDILRPFNHPASSKKRTNYCHWNGVVRVDLNKLTIDPPVKKDKNGKVIKPVKKQPPKKDSTKQTPEIRDLTVACIGEGNFKYTGARDGKSLHKFITKALLHKGGTKSPNGYYYRYEKLLKKGHQAELDKIDSLYNDSLKTVIDSLTAEIEGLDETEMNDTTVVDTLPADTAVVRDSSEIMLEELFGTGKSPAIDTAKSWRERRKKRRERRKKRK